MAKPWDFEQKTAIASCSPLRRRINPIFLFPLILPLCRGILVPNVAHHRIDPEVVVGVTFCAWTCWKWLRAPGNTFLRVTFCTGTYENWSRALVNTFLRFTFSTHTRWKWSRPLATRWGHVGNSFGSLPTSDRFCPPPPPSPNNPQIEWP